jgi:hypothetical protein
MWRPHSQSQSFCAVARKCIIGPKNPPSAGIERRYQSTLRRHHLQELDRVEVLHARAHALRGVDGIYGFAVDECAAHACLSGDQITADQIAERDRERVRRYAIIGVVSWSTGPAGTDGCGGLTGITPLSLHRAWIVETARKMDGSL